jgi:hypothetical protein
MESERDTKRIKLDEKRDVGISIPNVQTIKISTLLDKKPEISLPLEVARYNLVLRLLTWLSFGFDENNTRIHKGKHLLVRFPFTPSHQIEKIHQTLITCRSQRRIFQLRAKRQYR